MLIIQVMIQRRLQKEQNDEGKESQELKEATLILKLVKAGILILIILNRLGHIGIYNGGEVTLRDGEYIQMGELFRK